MDMIKNIHSIHARKCFSVIYLFIYFYFFYFFVCLFFAKTKFFQGKNIFQEYHQSSKQFGSRPGTTFCRA